MSSTGEDPYRIAALQGKRAAQYDLLRPGAGTPWEDRGSGGAVFAFIKTSLRSMFTPARLLDSLRRPETTSDANVFVWICGAMWSVGIIANDLMTYHADSGLADSQPDRWTLWQQQFWLETVLRVAIVPVVLYVFLKLNVAIFTRVSAGELRAVPRTLVQNLFAYCLGPSILAIIPPWYIGMPLAAFWILIDMIIAARKRLHMSASGAAVACILSWVCGVALVAACSAVIWFMWVHVLVGTSMEYTPASTNARSILMSLSLSPHLQSIRGRLLHRLGRLYAVRREAVHIGPIELDFFRIEDPDRVLDMVAAEADRREKLGGDRSGDLHLPYWAQLWDSALGVGTFLATREDWPKRLGGGMRVLDLGCGMGLVGAAAAALGARVLLADLEPPALLFAQLNTLAFRDRVRTRRLNWQRDGLAEKFDLIIGADILYEKEQWPFLEPFWRAHLCPGGTVFLGEPGRMTGELFLPWIARKGWEVRKIEQAVETRSRPIRLFGLKMVQN